MGRCPTADSTDRPARTLAEGLFRQLRSDIRAGRLAPGARLNLTEVAKSHAVSLTVVREAVTRLVFARLVETAPQIGFRVWPLSVPDLVDLTRVRVEIEALAVRESVQHGTLEWEADLVAAHHRLAGAPRSGPDGTTSDAWVDAHARFHTQLAVACTSERLKELRAALFDSAELYRHWSATVPTGGSRRDVGSEHRRIRDAAVAHDADLVVELAVTHIQDTTDRLLAARSDHGET